MIRLHLLLRDHPDAVEADLHRFYGVDLDLEAERPPTRWLLRRLRHVPHGQGAATRTLDGPEWTPLDEMTDEIRRRYTHIHYQVDGFPAAHPSSPEARAVVDDDVITDADIAAWNAHRAARAAALAGE